MARPVRLFVIDDSAVVRKVIAEVVEKSPGIELLGSASDPIFAMPKLEQQWPDVILLDIEMPRMDGLTFLRKIMSERPTPVVICSTLTEKGATASVEALAAGAVDVIAKPKVGLKDYLSESALIFVNTVKTAARASIRNPGRVQPPVRTASDVPARQSVTSGDRVVAIGTSTGGTQALETILTGLPADCPAIVVVQHMPAKFTAAFAQRLDQSCACRVQEARAGDKLQTGTVLIAPGGKHMQVRPSGSGYAVTISDGPPVSRHKPSVDVLFRSVAKAAGGKSVGIIMTGMGSDGARGLLEMRRAGASTAAQDQASSVVFGMPKEAIALGAAERTLPLKGIASFILEK